MKTVRFEGSRLTVYWNCTLVVARGLDSPVALMELSCRHQVPGMYPSRKDLSVGGTRPLFYNKGIDEMTAPSHYDQPPKLSKT